MFGEKRIPNLKPFTDASMGMQGPQDRQFSGSLNAIWCERELAIERKLTAGEFVENHIRNWNFSQEFDHLEQIRFEHEFCHLLLGLAFLKMGSNPTQYDFGYNGNEVAESLVIAMEYPFAWMRYSRDGFSENLEHWSASDYLERVKIIYAQGLQREAALLKTSFDQANDYRHGPITSFEIRRNSNFAELDEPLLQAAANISRKTGEASKWGEKLRAREGLSDEVIGEIFDCIWPVVKAIDRDLKTMSYLRDCSNQRQALTQLYLKKFLVSDIWFFMNNPKAGIEISSTVDHYEMKFLSEFFFNHEIEPSV